MNRRTPAVVLPWVVAVLLVAAVLAVGVVAPGTRDASGGNDGSSGARSYRRDASVYRGLGAWIDAYDYVPAYYRPSEGRLLVPEDADLLDEQGVRTLFLQATRLDPRSPEGIVDRELVGRFLEQAHEHDIRVVGWYLPKFGDLEADLDNLRKIRQFEFDGHRFDGLGVDIEWRNDVGDHAERSRRLVELSRRLREEAGSEALGAIVLSPVLIEAVHPRYWPDFPWEELSELYDVWLPMAYWTETPRRSGYRDGHRFTEESIRRLRANVGRPSALVHPVGGIADETTIEEFRGFTRAADEHDAVGLSLYDYRTTPVEAWDVLRRATRGD